MPSTEDKKLPGVPLASTKMGAGLPPPVHPSLTSTSDSKSEELTWAEIVHLKEGMFWARVAGVQGAWDTEAGTGED
ncbi:hypothetical protein BDP27DRAFT_1425335 [Rhodocollybia butyracea]|uniref:Uncharacterized protein n=1 Tax=Rhodocollybia butyracea TaxID=206335 RepID=A0A9P5PLX1_9AGAR|nr:hypothetical protein BDP27DRAFT_1425335 [Rhodocollybia butyracea]